MCCEFNSFLSVIVIIYEDVNELNQHQCFSILNQPPLDDDPFKIYGVKSDEQGLVFEIENISRWAHYIIFQ